MIKEGIHFSPKKKVKAGMLTMYFTDLIFSPDIATIRENELGHVLHLYRTLINQINIVFYIHSIYQER